MNKLFVILVMIGMILSFIWGVCDRPKKVESADYAEIERTIQWLDHHIDSGIPVQMQYEAIRILACENRTLDPKAISKTGDYGLFQINAYWQRFRLIKLGYTIEDLLDPIKNTIVAIDIWNEQAFRPWSCSR